jgi:hypothetical protein
MSQDAGLDIDYDGELARLQHLSGSMPKDDGLEPAPVIEGAVMDEGRMVTFKDRKFRIADKIGAMPLLKFSMYADMSVQDPKAMSAMYAMLRDCIHPGSPGCGQCEKCDPERCGDCAACLRVERGADADASPCTVNPPDDTACADYDPGDWKIFEEHAIDTRAGAEELLDVISQATELIAGRPTEPRSSSSGGRRAISGGSTGRSSARRAKGSRR